MIVLRKLLTTSCLLFLVGSNPALAFFHSGQTKLEAFHIQVTHPKSDNPNAIIANLFWTTLPDADQSELTFTWERPIDLRDEKRKFLSGQHIDWLPVLSILSDNSEFTAEQVDEKLKSANVRIISKPNDTSFDFAVLGEDLDARTVGKTLSHILGSPQFKSKHVSKYISLAKRRIRKLKFDMKKKQGTPLGVFLRVALFAKHEQIDLLARQYDLLYDIPPKQQLISNLKLVHNSIIKAKTPTVYGSGPQSVEEIVLFVRQALGSEERIHTPYKIVEETLPLTPKILIVQDKALEGTKFWAFGQAPKFEKSDDVGEMLSMRLFAGDLKTPLMQSIRGELNASYNLELGYYDFGRGVQVFELFGDLDTNLVPQSLAAFRRAYTSYRTYGLVKGVSKKPDLAKFNEVKNGLIKEHEFMFENPDLVSTELSEVYRFGLDPSHSLDLLERLRMARFNEHLHFLKRYLQPVDNLLIVLATHDPERLKARLESSEINQNICIALKLDQILPCFLSE